MLIQNQVEISNHLPYKVCPECGEHMNEQAVSYLQECDRCLSKKED
ncbi:MAG: hypothetical protein K0S25_1014 [Bacillus sp. (in: firmicutes)]|jgi:Zn finger protein HypA/HybF involved in hydrogenase expression|nr:protein YhfH [Bacillus sp. 1NLA3E]AGK54300.1 hypothetical protein B1NLA3E_12760 [Bacillus sp. 1NLA3E]MDF2903376.1 hypothetical protein [Bacillus sp. (in: firmicutes)]